LAWDDKINKYKVFAEDFCATFCPLLAVTVVEGMAHQFSQVFLKYIAAQL